MIDGINHSANTKAITMAEDRKSEDQDDDDYMEEGFQIIVSKPYDHGESVDRLYEDMTRKLAEVGAPWVPPDILTTPIGKYAGDPVMVAFFKKRGFKKPLNSFVLSITNRSRREAPEPSSFYDDYLIASYDKLLETQSYQHLVTSIFPKIVAAFGADAGELTNGQVSSEDWEVNNASDEIKPEEFFLGKVLRVWAANFWSDSLCKTAFGPSAADVVKRLQNEVVEARLYRGGALIISSHEEPTADEMRALDGRIRPLLVT
ncbi:MAG TPA: hypothetical protein VH105_09365 [Burkholderiales bacterium]|jgi:hypothetical protein|nr:hypothetical protein [Burkholderiales bacterium]